MHNRKTLNKTEKQILNFTQSDLPLLSSPYEKLANKLKLKEKEITKQIKVLKKNGYIRRFGALLNHEMLGFKSNCMCVWAVPAGKIKAMGRICSKSQSISHCYLRESSREFPFNFYTMIHAKTKTECKNIIRSISKESQIDNYKMMFTLKRFKKTSPKYEV